MTRGLVIKRMKMTALYDRRALLLEPNEQPTKRFAVISDLHISFEERFRGGGIRLQPSIDSIVSDVESLVYQYGVTELVINGDVKSGTDRILDSEWNNVPRFFSRISKECKVSVIPGNHDGGLQLLLPEYVGLEDINGKVIEDTLVLHGHTRPLMKFKDCRRMITGHIHPIFKKKGSPLSGSPVWAFLKVPKKLVFREVLEEQADELLDVVVMPSFNLELSNSGYVQEEDRESKRELGGFSLSRDFRSAEEAVIITLKGEVVGDIDSLRSLL